MPTVQVPGQGAVEFPDSMSDDQIADAIKKTLPPPSPTPASDAAVKETETTASIPDKIATAALTTVKQLIPRSVEAVAGIATPVVGAVNDVKRTYQMLNDWVSGAPMDEASKKAFPESQVLAEADKTPAGSQERYNAAGMMLAQMGMAAGLTRGILKPGGGEVNAATREKVGPQGETQAPQKEEVILPSEGALATNAPESATSAPFSSPGARVSSTAIWMEGKPFIGSSWNEPHAGVGVRHGFEDVPEESKGFIVRAPQGDEWFANREEAAQVADQAGQRGPAFKGDPLQSEHLIEPPTKPTVSGMGGPSIKAFERIYGEGEIPGGVGQSPEEMFEGAKARLSSGKADPYGVAARARTGAITPEEFSDLVVEHDRLVNEAAAKEGTPEYEPAYQSAKDFATNVLSPAKTRVSDTMRAMQIEAPIDYSRLTGFRVALEKRIGREMTPQEAPAFQKVANDVARARDDATSASIKTADQARKRFSGVKDISFEDAVKQIHDSIEKAVTDCGL